MVKMISSGKTKHGAESQLHEMDLGFVTDREGRIKSLAKMGG